MTQTATRSRHGLLAPHGTMWRMTRKEADELKEKMKRFSARLPQAYAALVQERLDEGGHSAQFVVETLLLDWALGGLDLRDSISRVREGKARLTSSE